MKNSKKIIVRNTHSKRNIYAYFAKMRKAGIMESKNNKHKNKKMNTSQILFDDEK